MGALDGTFVKLTVPAEERSRHRIRKGAISTNVLGVCDANLKFLYVLPGWEGSASDARVLRDALQRPNGLKVYNDVQTKQSGFTWDDERKMIVVTSDSSWSAYVESHPDAKGMHWDDIVLLCGKDRATGQGAENIEEGLEAMAEDEETEVKLWFRTLTMMTL
ncbi:UNVERIFIED_CONTAM: hypothetical protein Scaly_1984500 [Sesamum calycinum]|uniref:DDE Tnp4 domain-containing protein n=1 Tax=Sesamum calycinum TaxID=2727403 RepID=A0AAW2N042_9LAMI